LGYSKLRRITVGGRSERLGGVGGKQERRERERERGGRDEKRILTPAPQVTGKRSKKASRGGEKAK
jgi:hypothetical protein